MTELNRNDMLSEHSPCGRWNVVVYTDGTSEYLRADIYNLDRSAGLGALIGASFGPYPAPADADISLRWDLPDKVCGFYIASDCYGLFRYGRSRRRERCNFRAGSQLPFSADEIEYFCAKSHVQFTGVELP